MLLKNTFITLFNKYSLNADTLIGGVFSSYLFLNFNPRHSNLNILFFKFYVYSFKYIMVVFPANIPLNYVLY